MEIGTLNLVALNQLTPSTSPSDIGVAILGKQLEVSQQLEGEMIKALENSVTPHIGGNIDVSI
ncbi:MAG: putative motility protein [Lachnospiraceae bacterium]|jgi:hypothetical protein|nr:putative motility protein [Lachnospiraceae bacterium]